MSAQVWRKKVPAQDVVGEGKVALEHGRHLGAEALAPAELLKDSHGQQENLAQVFFLKNSFAVAMEFHTQSNVASFA